MRVRRSGRRQIVARQMTEPAPARAWILLGCAAVCGGNASHPQTRLTDIKHRRVVAAIAFVGACRAAVLLYGSGQPSVLARVPFELLANCPHVEATIDGRGPFFFELDTGSRLIFSRELAVSMGF